jgi:hypothetical protein
MLHLASSLTPNSLSIFDEFLSFGFNFNNSVYISTTGMVMDSHGYQGSPLVFNQQSPTILKNLTQFNLNTSQIQFLQCSKSLVVQSATIESQSNTIIEGSLHPNIHKNHSTWVRAQDLNFIPQDSTLLGSDLVGKIAIFCVFTYIDYTSGPTSWLISRSAGTHGVVWMSKKLNNFVIHRRLTMPADT